MVRGRSGIGGEKRTTRNRGDAILVVGGRWNGGRVGDYHCINEARSRTTD